MQSRLVGRGGAKGLLATIAALALLAPAASGKGGGGDAGKDGTGKDGTGKVAPKGDDKPAAKDSGGNPAATTGGGKPAGTSGDGKPAGTSGDGKPAGTSGGGKPADTSGSGKPAGSSGGGGEKGGGGGKGLPATTAAPAPTTTTATTPAPTAAAPTTAAPRSSTTGARSTKPRKKGERRTVAPKRAARRERRTRRPQVSPAAPRLRSIAGPQRPAMSFTALRPLSDSPVQPPATAAGSRPAARDGRRGVANRVDRLGHALAGIPDGVGRRLEAFRAYAGPVGTAAGAALASLLLTLMVSTAVGYRGTGLVTGTAALQAMRRRRWAAESHPAERPQSRPYGSQSW